jgi:hypothetical protein
VKRLTLVCSDEEAAVIRRAAEHRGCSVPELLRRCLEREGIYLPGRLIPGLQPPRKGRGRQGRQAIARAAFARSKAADVPAWLAHGYERQ